MIALTKTLAMSLTLLCVNAQVANAPVAKAGPKFDCLKPELWNDRCKVATGMEPMPTTDSSDIVLYKKTLPC